MSTLEDRTDVAYERPIVGEEPVSAAPAGDPSVLGLPAFVVGSIALGLALVGYIPATAQGSILPIVLAATGLGLFIATIWAAALAQSTVAGIFGVFTGFWWSYAALVLGLDHDWYAITPADGSKVVGAFLLCWTILIGLLTLATLRLPLAFSVLLGMVTLALALVTISTLSESPNLAKAGGVVVLLFAILGGYLFMSASATALAGKGYPLGQALQR